MSLDPRLAEWDDSTWFQAKCRDDLAPIYEEWAVKAAEGAGATKAHAVAIDCGAEIGMVVQKGKKRLAKRFPVDQAVIAEIHRWVASL